MRASAKSKPSIAMLVKVVCVPMALLGIAAIWAVVAPWLTLARLDRVYGEVQPGMSMEQVDALMSHDYKAQTSGWGSYWEWRPLPASELPESCLQGSIRYPQFSLASVTSSPSTLSGKLWGNIVSTSEGRRKKPRTAIHRI